MDLEIGLRHWTRPIPADVTEFVLEVPGHGTLAAEISRAALGPGSFDLILVVEGGQDLEPVRIDSWILEQVPGPFPLEIDLMPGTYRVEILSRPRTKGEREQAPEVVILPSRSITIEAGATTHLSPE